jgi:hypothetical protein
MTLFRPLLVALFLTATVSAPVVLTGCPGMATQVPQTFNERVVAGYSTVELAVSVVDTLFEANILAVPDARNAVTSIQGFKDAIDVAVGINATGDVTSAEGRLQAAITGLNALHAYLRSKQP